MNWTQKELQEKLRREKVYYENALEDKVIKIQMLTTTIQTLDNLIEEQDKKIKYLQKIIEQSDRVTQDKFMSRLSNYYANREDGSWILSAARRTWETFKGKQ